MAAERGIAGYAHGRVPRALREEQILAIAEELFAERGYEGASMDELARRAGVSKPVVYDIVGSKEALFGRCFERAGDELAAVVAAAAAQHAGDVAATLRATALAFLRFVASHERAWRVLYALDLGGRAASHVLRIRARQARYAAEVLRSLSPELDPARAEAAAWMLNGAFEALATWRRERPEVDDETAAGWLVALALPGLRELLGPRA